MNYDEALGRAKRMARESRKTAVVLFRCKVPNNCSIGRCFYFHNYKAASAYDPVPVHWHVFEFVSVTGLVRAASEEEAARG